MMITIPCECESEEHEEFIEVEWSFGRLGYNGVSVGDDFPCGRKATQKDIDYIFDYITHCNDDEG